MAITHHKITRHKITSHRITNHHAAKPKAKKPKHVKLPSQRKGKKRVVQVSQGVWVTVNWELP